MLSPFMQREIARVQRQWSPAERKSRVEAAKRQRAKLAELVFRSTLQSPDIWATGAMTAADLQRVAG